MGGIPSRGAMVHQVLAIIPTVGCSWNVCSHDLNLIKFKVGPQGSQAVTDGAVTITDRSGKLFSHEVDIATMAAELNHPKTP